jgi:hypothetical protein
MQVEFWDYSILRTSDCVVAIGRERGSLTRRTDRYLRFAFVPAAYPAAPPPASRAWCITTVPSTNPICWRLIQTAANR